MTTRLTFFGKGPFYLRGLEHVTANALDDTIQLTLFAKVEGQEQELFQIETQMALGAAILLANTLDRAINKAAQDPLFQTVQARSNDRRAIAPNGASGTI